MSNESKTARRMSRREFVKGAAVGAGAVTGLSALAGCSSSGGSAPASGAPEKWDREVDVVFVGADAALAEDHVGVSGVDNVLGGQEEFLQRGRPTALQQNGLLLLTDGFE